MLNCEQHNKVNEDIEVFMLDMFVSHHSFSFPFCMHNYLHFLHQEELFHLVYDAYKCEVVKSEDGVI